MLPGLYLLLFASLVAVGLGLFPVYYLGNLCCTLLVLLVKRRKEKQMEEKQKLFEVEKEKELYESKVSFFTEIAHEVRTPLTLINGPLEAIEEMDIKIRN